MKIRKNASFVRAYCRIQRKCQICSKRASYLGNKVDLILQNWYLVHSVQWGLNPPPPPPTSKTPLPSFWPSLPPLNQQTVQAPLFRHSLPSILVFHEPLPPHLKSRIFQWTPKILKFSILNTIISLVVTEKNIFAYKLFFVIKYFRF